MVWRREGLSRPGPRFLLAFRLEIAFTTYPPYYHGSTVVAVQSAPLLGAGVPMLAIHARLVILWFHNS